MNVTLPALMRSAAIVLSALLSACGGGGSPASPPDADPQTPTLVLTPTAARTFHFTWPEVAGATEYRLLEDPDGASGYTLVGQPMPAGTTQFAHEVFLPARITARYLLQACAAGVCADVASRAVTDHLAQAIGLLKADGPADDDNVGFGVAMSDTGDTLVVGAPGEDSAQDDSGAVHVFIRQGQTWQHEAFLKAPVPREFSAFGRSVALSANGDTLAVGAPGEDGVGAVYLFTRQGDTWTLSQRVQAATSTPNSEFGGSVALSSLGQVLVVGDAHEDSTVTDSGGAYVFTYDGTDWSQRALLKAQNPQGFDRFGISVAIDGAGQTIAVGSPDDSLDIPWGGSVQVFTGSGASWGTPVRLVPPTPVDDQGMGHAVALSRDGSTLVAGAISDDSLATGVGGDPTAIGAYASGAAHVFARQGAGWVHQAYLKASNTGEDDNFGASLALSANGDTLVVGAPYERSRADGINGEQDDDASSSVGAVYVFQRQGADWHQQAYVKAPNSGGGDEFGRSLALARTAAGQPLLCVGAPGEGSSGGGWNPAPDNDRPGSGAVYLY